MTDREGFIFYRSYYEAIKDLPAENFKECAKIMIEYGLDGVVPDTRDPLTKMCFDLTKPQFDANNKRRENGKLGGAPLGNQNARKTTENNQKQPKTTEDNQKQPKEKEKEKVKEKVKDIKESTREKTPRVFTPPALEEVKAYIAEKGYHVNPERFIDFYTSKGWMVGKNKMKDWRACVRTWERADETKAESNRNKFVNFSQTNYDFAELERIAGIK